MSNDHELLQAFVKDGSEAAFAELVKRHSDVIYGAALRQVMDPHAAQEICQTVFILLSKKAHSIRPNLVLIGWLLNATRYACRDWKKATYRRLNRETAAFEMNHDPHESENDATALWQQLSPVIDEAVNSLPEKDRDAIWLRFFQNKSLQEVGAVLGCAEDAARKRVARAIDRLQVELKRKGISSPASALPAALLAQPTNCLPDGFVASALSAVIQPRPGLVELAEAVSFKLGLATFKSSIVSGMVVLVLAFGAAGKLGGFFGQKDGTVTVQITSDYRLAGFADPAVVHHFLNTLRRNLLAGRVSEVLGMCRYPLRVNSTTGTFWIPDAHALESNFERVFTPGVCSILLKSPLEGLLCNREGVAVSDGAVWVAPILGSPQPAAPQIVSINVQ